MKKVMISPAMRQLYPSPLCITICYHVIKTFMEMSEQMVDDPAIVSEAKLVKVLPYTSQNEKIFGHRSSLTVLARVSVSVGVLTKVKVSLEPSVTVIGVERRKFVMCHKPVYR